ncbi:hypothetical protein BXT86_03145 [candidate division WOR-3 bacterium 4484_100]|uniref:RNA-binding S4 domain-containing protein n=1 Tax=candidate division WOR-3 bacterium 4484_100 TaxID=1936077 RepID=A0A1V4QGE2_UNCW3|nr:MAG: hypothetical protein BXT86_03145 [candidate division WOR-3 bacterium 4484_100]
MIAKIMCDKNYVRLNGHYVKPSKAVNIGDLLEIETPKGTRKFLIQDIPTGNVKKAERNLYYQEITEI